MTTERSRRFAKPGIIGRIRLVRLIAAMASTGTVLLVSVKLSIRRIARLTGMSAAAKGLSAAASMRLAAVWRAQAGTVVIVFATVVINTAVTERENCRIPVTAAAENIRPAVVRPAITGRMVCARSIVRHCATPVIFITATERAVRVIILPRQQSA